MGYRNRCSDCEYSCAGGPNALSDICDGCQHDPDTGWGGYTDHSQEDEYGSHRHYFDDCDDDDDDDDEWW